MKKKKLMKLKSVNKRTRGITLIALVITIVVLLILAGITISLVFSENGIITKAREAAEKTNEAITNEQKGLDQLYNDLVNALNGNQNEKWDEEKVYTVESADGITVPVPKGYTASSATGENTVNGGFVIYEGEETVTDSNVTEAQTTRNQFVWVPVKDINEYKLISWNGEKVADKITGEESNDTYYNALITNIDISDEKANKAEEIDNSEISIKTYGGFYVGRYEASYDTNTNKIETMKNKEPYTNVSYQETISLGLSKIEGRAIIINHNFNNVNNIISGKQWDAMIKWINETNYNPYNKGYTGSSKINTGSNEEYKINNIYDITGNVAEWSIEYYGTNKENVVRGGAYNQSDIKANQREHNNGEASEQIGFRQMILLPIKILDEDLSQNANSVLM